MPGKMLLRSLMLAGFVAALIAWNGPALLQPQHRPVALLFLTCGLGFALFFELMAREIALEWCMAALLGVIGAAGLSWIVLARFYVPLPNDQTPLLPLRTQAANTGCPTRGALNVALGRSWISGGANPFTPFRAGTCPGPSLTRTARGLVVNAYGYDLSGAMIFRIQDNQFTLMLGDYLHLHRTDRGTLAVYDKGENEIVYVRYLSPDTVRLRGRFLCGDTRPVTISDNAITPGNPLPPCMRENIRLGSAD